MSSQLDKALDDLKSLEDAQKVKDAEYVAASTQGLTVNQLTLMIIYHKLDLCKLESVRKITEYQRRREAIQPYTKALDLLNKNATTDGIKLKQDDAKTDEAKAEVGELRGLLEEFKKNGLAIDVKDNYDAQDRDRLVENLKRGLEDLNVQNNMTLEGLQQSCNERYEAYQYARSIMKAGHDAGQQVARNIAK